MARKSKKSATQSSSTPPTTPLTDNAAAARFLEKHRAKPARGSRSARAECSGHPAGPHDPMGQTVYCDGSCNRRLRSPAPSTPVDSQSRAVDGAQPAAASALSAAQVGTRRAQGVGMHKRGKSSTRPSNPEAGSLWADEEGNVVRVPSREELNGCLHAVSFALIQAGKEVRHAG